MPETEPTNAGGIWRGSPTRQLCARALHLTFPAPARSQSPSHPRASAAEALSCLTPIGQNQGSASLRSNLLALCPPPPAPLGLPPSS